MRTDIKIGTKLCARETWYMYDGNGCTGNVFLYKGRWYEVVNFRKSSDGDEGLAIISEYNNNHFCSFNKLNKYFYTILELRKDKLKKLNSI